VLFSKIEDYCCLNEPSADFKASSLSEFLFFLHHSIIIHLASSHLMPSITKVSSDTWFEVILIGFCLEPLLYQLMSHSIIWMEAYFLASE
jgi:hypothetical protein